MSDPWDQSRAGASAAEPVPDAAPEPATPQIQAEERYDRTGVIGRGGMGRVWVAQDRVLRREVALKEMLPPADAARALRMAREAFITARLDHPGVIGVHDAGTLPDGRPFYTMRLMRGRSLAAALSEASGPAERLALLRHLLAAAEAVAFAHQAGVVHRDLKPDNILLGSFGETQVGDWGLACPTPAAEARWADLPPAPPERGVGTPGWMSPEQALGQPPHPTADVWGLGAILATLLLGHPPTLHPDTSSALLGESPRPPPALVFPPDASPELAAIARRAMAPLPADRYPEAGALAADLLAWFEGRRVSAYAYTSWDLVRRLARAWRAPLGVAAVASLALAAAIAVGWSRTQAERDRALAAEAAALRARSDAEQRLSEALAARAADAVRADNRPEAERLAAAALAAAESPLARGVLAAFGRTPRPALLEVRAGPPCGWADLSADGATLLCGERDAVSLWTGAPLALRWRAALANTWTGVAPDGDGPAWGMELGGTRTPLAAGDGALGAAIPLPADLWSPVGGERVQVEGDGLWPADRSTPPPCAGQPRLIVRDAARYAALCGGGDVVVGDLSGRVARRLPLGLAGELDPSVARWSPDGRTLVVGSIRGRLWVFDATTGATLHERETGLGTVGMLEISPDGRWVAASGPYGGVGLWDLNSDLWLGEVPAPRPRAMTFSDAATLEVYAAGTLTRWGLPAAVAAYRYTLPAGLADVAVRPDGAEALTAGGDGQIHRLDLRGGAVTPVTDLGDGVVKAVAYSPDGRRLVAAGMVGPRTLIWDTAEGPPRPPSPLYTLRRVAFLGEGGLVGLDVTQGCLIRWERLGQDARPSWCGHSLRELEVTPEGDRAVLLGQGGKIWSVRPDEEPALIYEAPDALAVASAHGWLAAAEHTRVLLVGPDGATRALAAAGADLQDVQLSRDAGLVAAVGMDGQGRVWDTRTGALLALLPGHTERAVSLAFGPDGTTLATASWDHTVRVWDLRALRAPVAQVQAEIARAWQTVDAR